MPICWSTATYAFHPLLPNLSLHLKTNKRSSSLLCFQFFFANLFGTFVSIICLRLQIYTFYAALWPVSSVSQWGKSRSAPRANQQRAGQLPQPIRKEQVSSLSQWEDGRCTLNSLRTNLFIIRTDLFVLRTKSNRHNGEFCSYYEQSCS